MDTCREKAIQSLIEWLNFLVQERAWSCATVITKALFSISTVDLVPPTEDEWKNKS